MINIIKYGDKEFKTYRLSCHKCGTIFTFNNSDISKFDNRDSYEWFINCPFCSLKIILESDGSQEDHYLNINWEEYNE